MSDARTLEIILKAKDNASKVMDGVSKNAGGMGSKLGAVFGKLALAAGGLVVLDKVKDFLVSATKAAQEEAVQIAALNTVMANTGATQAQMDAMLKYVDATTMASGVADDKLYPALAVLQAATKDTTKSQELLNVAMDVAAARHVDLQTVAVALSKAEQGQTTSLGRLGVAVKDTAGEMLPFEKIVDQLRTTYGGAQKAIADADPWMVAKNAWGEAKEMLGQQLLPIVQKVGRWFADHMPEISTVMQKVGTAVGKALSGLSAAFSLAWPYIKGVVKNVVDWFKSPQGAAVMGTVISAVKTAINLLKGVWEVAWPAVHAALSAAWKIIGPILSTLLSAINKVIDALKWLKGYDGPTASDFNASAWSPSQQQPQIYAHAVGGIFDRATMGVFGEAGRETIIPNTKPQRALELLYQSGMLGTLAAMAGGGRSSFAPSFAGAGGGGSVTIVHEHRIYLDGRELNRALGKTTEHSVRAGSG